MASDWKKVKIKDILKISKDKIPLSKVDIETYISTDNMLPNYGGITTPNKLPSASTLTVYKPRDILFSNIRTYFKKVWFSNHKGSCSNDVIVFRANDKVDSKFAFYTIANDEFIQYTVQTSKGTKMPRGDKNAIKEYVISLPSLPEQKAIAHVLGMLDDKIELNRQMNDTLEAMAQALFKSWFVNFDPILDNALRAGNSIPEPLKKRAEQRQRLLDNNQAKYKQDIHDLFPSEFEFTEEGGWIPKGWQISEVGAEFDVTMGQSPPSSTYNEIGEGVYFFQGSTDFGFRFPTPRVYCTQPKRLANKRDTLVSVRAPVGDTNMAADDCCIGRGLAALRHNSGSVSFTYYSMLQLKEKFKIYEGEGTVFGSINQKTLKSLLQIKPTNNVIQCFEEMAGEWDKKIELNSAEILNLTKLRDTLLPKLISGELRLPESFLESAVS